MTTHHPLAVVRLGTSDVEVFRQIFVEKAYEFDLPHPVEYVLDLGSNTGLSTMYFSQRYKNAEIAFVEPNPECYNVGQDWTGNCYGFLAAIGPEVTWADFERVEEPGGGDWALRVKYDPKGADALVITVEDVITARCWPRIDLLKCDIEGSEDDLFSRNTDWLHITNAVVIELHEYLRPGVANRVASTLARYGILFSRNIGENALFIRPVVAQEEEASTFGMDHIGIQ